MPTEFCIVLVTTPNETCAKAIARTLLTEKLAACINCFAIESFYTWNNELNQDHEFQLIIKTQSNLFTTLSQRIQAIHPYDTPEFLVLGLHSERRVLDALRLTTLEQIVLDAPCAALIAHLPPDAPYRNVLTATDFLMPPHRRRSWPRAWPPLAQHHAIHAVTAPLGGFFNPKARAERLARAEAQRDRFMQTPGLPALADPLEIIPGGVHEVLRFRTDELGADLVCLGVHSGRNPKILGKYTRDLMRAPPTDLLLGRPQR
ncbi:MAG: divalent cation tolerance protein CutA [Alkalinema sp. RL_2_19]|nr:divalent cation tolerance protein CutA [Alkalinema sp. RL_2_19]